MTKPAGRPHRSRQAWPDTAVPDWAPSEHTHELPSWLRRVLLAVGGFMLMFALGLGCLAYYVYLDHEYVMGRGRFRDVEAQRMQEQTTEQIRSAICSLLDGLPAGPLLDGQRLEYDCGPGVSREDLTPEQQGQLQDFSQGLNRPTQPLPRLRPRPDATG